MRLLTFSTTTATSRIGALARNGRIIDLRRAARAAGIGLPFDATSMLSLIESGAKGLAAARKAVAAAKEGHYGADAVRFHAPIPRPRKNVFCVGWNYVEHFEEGAKARPHVQEMPAHPAFFTKAPTAVNGPYDDVPAHTGVTEKLDWEVELGVIIGRGGADIPEADAMKYVFGYCVINDVSARDIQRRHGQQWFKGKTLDGHCPMGPWIVTADEVQSPHDLRVTCRVNGVTKQDSNTRHMYFKIPRLLAELSAGMTLEPGDILSSGTPAGVGHARNPPEFMKPGDILETEIPGIGLLRNRIGR